MTMNKIVKRTNRPHKTWSPRKKTPSFAKTSVHVDKKKEKKKRGYDD